MHKCLSCGKPITWNFAICSDCEQKWGSSALTWPEWLRFSWNDLQRTRRREAKQRVYEVPLADDQDLDYYDE